VSLNPNSTKGLLALAQTCDLTLPNDPERERLRLEAKETYRRVLRLDPRSTEALRALVRLLLFAPNGTRPSNAQLNEAEGLGRRLLLEEPSCSSRKLLVEVYDAQRHARIGNPNAIPFLTESLTTCSADWYAAKYFPLSLAQHQEQAGDLVGAEKNYCRAVEQANYGAMERCLTLRASHSADRTIDRYDPGDDWLGHFLLGTLGTSGEPEQVQHLEKSATLNPAFRLTFKELAARYRDKKDHARACQALKRAYDLGMQQGYAEASVEYHLADENEHCR
jgi:hypothetical protein